MKTLKDIDSDCKVCNDLQKLRISAIELIKEDIENYRNSKEMTEVLKNINPKYGRIIHNFIVNMRYQYETFFNITEEDLK